MQDTETIGTSSSGVLHCLLGSYWLGELVAIQACTGSLTQIRENSLLQTIKASSGSGISHKQASDG